MVAVDRVIAVAKNPAPDAMTYREVVDRLTPNAEVVSPAFVNEHTPEGHFGMTVIKENSRETYWFSGELGDGEARMVARTIRSMNFGPLGVMHFLGSMMHGGRYYGGSPFAREARVADGS